MFIIVFCVLCSVVFCVLCSVVFSQIVGGSFNVIVGVAKVIDYRPHECMVVDRQSMVFSPNGLNATYKKTAYDIRVGNDMISGWVTIGVTY